MISSCFATSVGAEVEADRFELLRAHIQTWLAGVEREELLITSAALQEEIAADWSRQREHYQIISVRWPEHYHTAGHIPRAENIYWVDLMQAENLERLERDKMQILYCYYGHGSMISAVMLNLLGIESRSLDGGMMTWNEEAMVKEPWDREADYAVETTYRQPVVGYSLPELSGEAITITELVTERAWAYLGGEGSPVIQAAALKEIVDVWEERGGDYQIVDVRLKAEYADGHVPYALHIPWRSLADLVSLGRLDPAKTAIVYSYNGQLGQMAATLLNLLGYPSVNLLFGMLDWNLAQVAEEYYWKTAAGYPIKGAGIKIDRTTITPAVTASQSEEAEMSLTITSSAFEPGGEIPARYTCDGEDVSPPLTWTGIPDGAQSLVLVVDDPDAPDPEAPRMTWVHWVLYNLPPDAKGLPEAVTSDDLPVGTREGLNDWKRTGYGGPCPPIGRHRYFHKLYALDQQLPDLGAATKTELEAAISGHILGMAELVGTCERTR